MRPESLAATYKVPTIDFGLINPGTPEWESVRSQVRQALEEYGCVEASFNKVPLDIRKAMFGAAEQLLDLPLQTKLRNEPRKLFPGYIGNSPILPLYETIAVEDATMYSKVESLMDVFWPQGNPSLCQTLQVFSEQVSELDKILRRMIFESLGVEKYLDQHMESANYLLRVTKYKEAQTTDRKTKQLGLISHTDKGFITILYQNEVNGLEVQITNGQWISVKPSPNSFIILCGDSLHALANGRLHSAPHRVMMTGNQTRYTVGLFSMPKGGYLIKAPEELVDEHHPLLFKPFDFSQFMDFSDTEAGQTVGSPLKAFCGV